MKKNFDRKKLYCIIFAILICFPVPLGYSLGLRGAEAENRALAEPPSFSFVEYRTFSERFETWFNDYLPFKDQLTNLHSRINLRLFQVSPTNRVIVGKDGWLFYNSAPTGDGDELSDYIGAILYTPEELDILTQNVIQMQQDMDERSIDFYIFIPSNKSSIYGEKMPSYFHKASKISRTEQLINHLRENTDVKIVFPQEKLVEESKNNQLYRKYDSHWNELGAIVATNELLLAMGKDLHPIDEINSSVIAMENNGDLTGLMNMDSMYYDDPVYDISGYLPQITLTQQTIESSVPKFPIDEFNSNSSDSRSVVVLGDSYRDATESTFPKNFQTCTYMVREAWEESFYDKYQPDIIVLEIVERVVGPGLSNYEGM